MYVLVHSVIVYHHKESTTEHNTIYRQYCHLGQAQGVQNIIKSLARKTCILTTTAFYNRKNILASHTHCTYVPSGHVYLHELGTAFNPAPSCKDLQPHRTSGWYVIKKNVWPSIRSVLQHGPGGMWEGRRVGMRVANLDMTQPNQECPPEFRTITALTMW